MTELIKNQKPTLRRALPQKSMWQRRSSFRQSLTLRLAALSLLFNLSLTQTKSRTVIGSSIRHKSYSGSKYVYHWVGCLDVTRTTTRPIQKVAKSFLLKSKNTASEAGGGKKRETFQGVIRARLFSDSTTELRITFKKADEAGFGSSSGIKVKFEKPTSFSSSSSPQSAEFLIEPDDLSSQGRITSLSAVEFSKSFPYYVKDEDSETRGKVKLIKMRAEYLPLDVIKDLRAQNSEAFYSKIPFTELELIYTHDAKQYRIFYQEQFKEDYDIHPAFSLVNEIDKTSTFVLPACCGIILIHLILLAASYQGFKYHRSCRRTLSTPFGLLLFSYSTFVMMIETSGFGFITLMVLTLLVLSLLLAISNLMWVKLSLESSKEKLNPMKFEYNFNQLQVKIILVVLCSWVGLSHIFPGVIAFHPVLYCVLASLDLAYDWVPAERFSVFFRRLMGHCLVALAATELIFGLARRDVSFHLMTSSSDLIAKKRLLNHLVVLCFFVIFLTQFVFDKLKWESKNIKYLSSMEGIDKKIRQVMAAKITQEVLEKSCSIEPISLHQKEENGRKTRISNSGEKIQFVNFVGGFRAKTLDEPQNHSLALEELTKISNKLNQNQQKVENQSEKGDTKRGDFSSEDTDVAEIPNQEEILNKYQKKLSKIGGQQLSSFFVPKSNNIRTSGLYSIISHEREGFILKHTTLKTDILHQEVPKNKKIREACWSRRGWMIGLNPRKSKTHKNQEQRQEDGSEEDSKVIEDVPIFVNEISIPSAPRRDSDFLSLLKIHKKSGRGKMRLVNMRTKKVVLNCWSVEEGKNSKALKKLSSSIILESCNQGPNTFFRSSVVISPKKDTGLIRVVSFSRTKCRRGAEAGSKGLGQPMSCSTMTFRKSKNLVEEVANNSKLGMSRKQFMNLTKKYEVKISKKFNLHDFIREEQTKVICSLEDFETSFSDCGEFIFLKTKSQTITKNDQEGETSKNEKSKKQKLIILKKFTNPKIKNLPAEEEERAIKDEETNQRQKRAIEVDCFENYQLGCSLEHLKQRVFGKEEVVEFGQFSGTTAYLLMKEKLARVDFLRGKLIDIIRLSSN